MKKEIEKFEYYLKEAEAHTKVKLNFYPDKNFYELWENVQKPRAFTIPDAYIKIRDIEFDLVTSESQRVACFVWDNSEECAALIIETENWRDKILFMTQNGETDIIRKDPDYIDDMGITYGEKLEIIFDIIYYLRANKKEIDIFSIKKAEYIDALDGISQNYPKRTINVMKKHSLASVKRMIKKASEDIPHDELSNQMHLPLDGVYITPETSEKKKSKPNSKKIFKRTHTIKRFSNWTVNKNFELMKVVLNEVAKLEQNLIIPLRDAEIIDTFYDNAVFKIQVKPKHNLTERSFLNVHTRDKRKKIGTVIIDIIENTHIYGRIRFFEPAEQALVNLKDMYARLQNSPTQFLAEGMEEIFKNLQKNELPDILKVLSGLSETSFSEAPSEDIYNTNLEEYQIQALNSVLDDNIPVVLVQGPPGTGKTSVLVKAAELLASKTKRILITAPSNTAVDNICRKIQNTPTLRFGNNPNSIAPDIKDKYWISNERSVINFIETRKKIGGGVYAGTHVGLLKDPIIQDEVQQNGLFDVIIFDEAGMASVAEFLMLSKLSKKTVLFGDHKQLPPFPIQDEVLETIEQTFGPRLSQTDAIIKSSAMEFLANYRLFPITMLRKSFRCQNPRLLRFSSIMFYDALVSASKQAEYFSLPYHERKKKYPKGTLKLISTSNLPDDIKNETFDVNAGKPGISNICEAMITVQQIYAQLKKYPLKEITVISPYKKQTKLIRKLLNKDFIALITGKKVNNTTWNNFLHSNISTIDSFQGGESDAVIISYVRSNNVNSIGFTDNHNRINVAHTRCRKEMIIIGDIQCLKQGANNLVFERLERSVTRDGEIINISSEDYAKLYKALSGKTIKIPKKQSAKTTQKTESKPEKQEVAVPKEKITPEVQTTTTTEDSQKTENKPEKQETTVSQEKRTPEVQATITTEDSQKTETKPEKQEVAISQKETTPEVQTTTETENNKEIKEKESTTPPTPFTFIETLGTTQPDLF